MHGDHVLGHVVGTEDDIDAVFQRLAVREGKQRVQPHYNDLSLGRLAEKFHILRNGEHERIAAPDAPLSVCMKNRSHIATGIFTSSGVYS